MNFYKKSFLNIAGAVFFIMCSWCALSVCGHAEGDEYIEDSAGKVWSRTGIVFESISSDYTDADIYELSDKNYYINDINILAENTDGEYRTVFCSGSLTYNSAVYSLDDVLVRLEDTGKYVNIEEDCTLHTDAISYRTDSYMKDQWYLSSIDADKSWNLISDEPGKDVVVAVIDTGVDYTHKDLADNMWVNEMEANGVTGYDDDGNGIIDDIYGANFSTENKSILGKGDPADSDKEGHGTHVAGIIAMTRGNGGGCGIAYGSKIMAVKAGNSDGTFKVSSVISALDYAVKMGANVINMSFGTYSESSVFKSMLERISDNCVLVAAAGNDGYVTTDYQGEDAHNVYPGSYPCVLGVMAADSNNVVTEWSNYDYEQYTDAEYEIAAPGYRILSTMPSGKYAYMSGTSMATPMVSAAAAVLYGVIDKKNMDTPALYVYGQLTQASGRTASRTDMQGSVHTYPMLNLYNSLVSTLKGGYGLNININKFNYYYYAGAKAFDKAIEVDNSVGSITVNCGYRVNNLWQEAKNVTVSVRAESDICKNSDSEVDIAILPAISSLTVSCHSVETYSFEVDCSNAGTYNIPIIYTVKAVVEDDDEPFIQQYMDVITVKVNAGEDNNVVSGQNISSAVSDNTSVSVSSDTSSAAAIKKPSKVKITKVTRKSGKKYKNILYWKKASGAKKYVVYYAQKRNGTYRKLAVTSAKKYTHSFKKKRTYYYKIRAYNSKNGSKVYGKYSSIIAVKRG